MSGGHVLAARCDSLGDVLLAGPALRALRAGADRLTLLCGPRGRAAAELLPAVDALHIWHTPWIDAEPEPVDRAHAEALVAWAAAQRFDQAVIFTSFHQSPLPLALLLRIAGVPRIVAISVDYPGSLLDVRHRVSDDVHEVERALSLAGAAGFALPAGDDGALRIELAGDTPDAIPPGARAGSARAAATSRGRVEGERYVVVHPGAAVPARAWAPERHRETVARLAERGRRVLVTGGPHERALTAYVAAGGHGAAGEGAAGLGGGAVSAGERGTGDHARVLDLGGRLTLRALAAALARADAVVVGNTGPAHLAAAVGTPVVSLFAPTVPAVRWRPWGVPHELLSVAVACAGCRARACPVPGHPCLDDVPPEAVLAALDRLAPAPAPKEEIAA